jgi:hypothetical protein
MWYIVAIVIALAGLIFGVISTLKAGPPGAGNVKNQDVDHRLKRVTPPDSIYGKYTRGEITDKLRKLVNSPPPVNLKPGAMCYDMAGPPATAEYICPVCGEKTIYTEENTYTVQYGISSCRTTISSIKGLGITLDESQFCRKCRPEVEKPELCIQVKYKDEEKPHVCCKVSSDDLELIYEFINGEKKHAAFNGEEYPLKDYAARLKELLGITINE